MLAQTTMIQAKTVSEVCVFRDVAKRPESVQNLQNLIPVQAESFIVIIHLKPDWSAQAPVDVQQPFEDKHAILLLTHMQKHADNNYQPSWSEGISCWRPATAAPFQVYVQTQALTAFTRRTLHRRESRSGWTHPLLF